ncbi:MAG: hypothetical protein SPI20_08825, partial [Ruminococcus callidus]|nr:hypothetical protein [Ruminococcus sp.]MDY6145795.1 hypothetical protein [Ruminococcus callidus]
AQILNFVKSWRKTLLKIKSFLLQQFFKNAGEVWASSPHLRSKSNFQMKCNKNLRENRKESQRIAIAFSIERLQ